MSKTKRALETLEEYPKLQEAALAALDAIWHGTCLISALGPRGKSDEEFDAVQMELLEAGSALELRLGHQTLVQRCTIAGATTPAQGGETRGGAGRGQK